MKVNVYNIVSVLAFLINPILGLISSFIGLYKSQKSQVLCFTYSLCVAISISKNKIYADSIAYNEIYNEVTSSDLKEIDPYITYKYISYFFKELGISYEVLPFLHVLLMTFFLTKSILILSSKYNFTGTKFILSVIGLTILANPIVASMGQRNSLAIFIVIYAVISFYNRRVFSSSLWLVTASLIHFTMTVFIPILYLSRLIKLDKLKYFILALIAIFSSLFFEKIIKIIFINEGVEDFTNKYQEINYDLGGGGIFVYNFILYSMKFFYYLCFLRYGFAVSHDYLFNNVRNFILLMTVLCIFLISNPVAFGRFTNYTLYLIFLYMLIYSSKFYVSFFIKLFMFISCLGYLIFYNIFPWREPILNGEMHLALLFPSFYTIWDIF